MKVSRYNFLLEEEDGFFIAFNSMTGALCSLEKELYDIYKKLSSPDLAGTVDMADPETASFIKEMKNARFFVDDGVDELSLIKERFYSYRYDANNLGLTIAPTMDCNFNCAYCYESEKTPEYMSIETERSILKYVENFASTKPGGEIMVSWFGGEPTLAIDTIYRLSDGIIEIARRNQVGYRALLVTNGYLLDRNMAIELSKRCVGSVQVTIDGHPELHDKRRPLKNGGKTFDVILKNLKDIADIIKRIGIRVNIDSENINEFGKFLEIFKAAGLPDNVNIFPSRVDSQTKACQSVSESVVGVPLFAKEHVKLYRMMIEKDMPSPCLPKPNLHSCTAIHKESMLIHPNGDIYKCWNTVGDTRECMGNINDLSSYNKENNKWVLYDPLKNKKCLKCKILPLCMANCPHLKLGVEAYVEPDGKCSEHKYNLQDLIRLMYWATKRKARIVTIQRY